MIVPFVRNICLCVPHINMVEGPVLTDIQLSTVRITETNFLFGLKTPSGHHALRTICSGYRRRV